MKHPIKEMYDWIHSRKDWQLVGDKGIFNNKKYVVIPTIVFSWDELSDTGHKYCLMLVYGHKYRRYRFGPIVDELIDVEGVK